MPFLLFTSFFLASDLEQTNRIESESDMTFSGNFLILLSILMNIISFVLGVSILNVLETRFTTLECKLRSIDNKNDQKMAQLTKKIDYLASSSISVGVQRLICLIYFFLL